MANIKNGITYLNRTRTISTHSEQDKHSTQPPASNGAARSTRSSSGGKCSGSMNSWEGQLRIGQALFTGVSVESQSTNQSEKAAVHVTVTATPAQTFHLALG